MIVIFWPPGATGAPLGVGTPAAVAGVPGVPGGAGTAVGTGRSFGGSVEGVAPGTGAAADFGGAGGAFSCCHACHRNSTENEKITNRMMRRVSITGRCMPRA